MRTLTIIGIGVVCFWTVNTIIYTVYNCVKYRREIQEMVNSQLELYFQKCDIEKRVGSK